MVQRAETAIERSKEEFVPRLLGRILARMAGKELVASA
jgi:hypothetical protein